LQNKNSDHQKSVLIVTTDHGMKDSGGHSGNSFAEIHVPLLMIGDSDCKTNNETFYKQIDFATTFSLMNGLPIPTESIGSVIPELLGGLKPIERLVKLQIVNRRLLTMIEGEYAEGM
jgi:ethanolaminephosphotransferase